MQNDSYLNVMAFSRFSAFCSFCSIVRLYACVPLIGDYSGVFYYNVRKK